MRPSGFRARRIWRSVPGRSFTRCRERPETTRSREASAKGSASSSAWQAGAVALGQQAGGGLYVRDRLDPGQPAQPPADEAMVGAEARGLGKAPVDGAEALHQVVGHACQQEVVRVGAGRCAVAARHQQAPVEDVLHGHDVAFLSLYRSTSGASSAGRVPNGGAAATFAGRRSRATRRPTDRLAHRTWRRAWRCPGRRGGAAHRPGCLRRPDCAAVLPRLPRPGRRPPPAVRGLLEGGALHPPSVVRRPGHPPAVRYRRAHLERGRGGAPPGLRPGPCRGALQRRHAHPGAPAQVRRPPRRPHPAGALAGRGGARAAARHRGDRARAAEPAAAVAAPVQPGGAAGG